MMKTSSDFFDGPGKRLRSYENVPEVIQAYDFLSQPETILKMTHYSKAGRPALEAVVFELEDHYLAPLFAVEPDSYSLKQMIGRMIRFILEDFGWVKKGSLKVVGGNFFSNASTYTFEEGAPIKYCLVTKVHVEEVE